MTKLTCPTCARALTRLSLSGRPFFACADDGLAVRATELAHFIRDQRVAEDFLAKLAPRAAGLQPTHRRCPSCARGMGVFQTSTFNSLDVDVCGRCRLYWFDRGEWEEVRNQRFGPLGGTAPPASLAPSRAAPDAVEAHLDAASPLELFGLNVAESVVEKRGPPFATYLLTFASLGFTAALRNMPSLGARWVFDPRAPFQHLMLTPVSAMLAHADGWHWLGNAYFLWMVGPDVEEEDGPAFVLLLCLLGATVGDLAYAHLGFTVPTLGLSGGVATLMVYWAARYPRNRVRLGRFGWMTTFGAGASVSVSAPTFAAMYFLKDAYGLMWQLRDVGHPGGVNYVAHVAGAAVGLLAAVLRPRERTGID